MIKYEYVLAIGEFYALTEDEIHDPWLIKFMKLIEKHKKLIAWYQKKLQLSDYGLLWLVFFKGVIVALIIERLILP